MVRASIGSKCRVRLILGGPHERHPATHKTRVPTVLLQAPEKEFFGSLIYRAAQGHQGPKSPENREKILVGVADAASPDPLGAGQQGGHIGLTVEMKRSSRTTGLSKQ